jgi:hypothetical protein
MKNFNNKYILYIVLIFSIILSSCGSSDEYCQDEEPIRIGVIDTVYKEVKNVEDSKMFVQIGAFVNKNYADEFALTAKDKLSTPVEVKLFSDGIYRLLVGEFEDIQEAKKILGIVKSRGYTNAFIRDIYGPVELK